MGQHAPNPPLIPAPKTSRILSPITPHRRPAGEQWWGGPGGDFAFSHRLHASVATGRATPRTGQFQNRRPEAVFVSLKLKLRGESRLGVRRLFDNRVTGGASARADLSNASMGCTNFRQVVDLSRKMRDINTRLRKALHSQARGRGSITRPEGRLAVGDTG